MHLWAIFCHNSSHFKWNFLNPLSGRQTTLGFKNILTQMFFYQKANLGQLTAKSEKVEFFWDTLMLMDRTGVEDKGNHLGETRLRWLGRLERMDETNLVKIVRGERDT